MTELLKHSLEVGLSIGDKNQDLANSILEVMDVNINPANRLPYVLAEYTSAIANPFGMIVPVRSTINDLQLLSRRDFLRLLGLSSIAVYLAACGVPLPDTSPATQPVLTLKYKEINGILPGNYSDIIAKNGLKPRIFEEVEPPEQRIKGAIDYLRRFRTLLEAHPELRGNPLSNYRINSTDNFPIAIPNNPTDPTNNWNVYDVINTFLSEYDRGIKGEKNLPTTRVTYQDNLQNITSGTINDYDFNGKQKIRRTNIVFGNILMLNNFIHFENQNEVYGRFTDVELALLILHEFCHGLQGEAFITMVNLQSQYGHSGLEEVGLAAKVVGIGNNKDQLRALELEAIQQYNLIRSRKNGLDKTYQLHEAQGTAVSYMFLNLLNRLNGSSYFPGTRYADISEEEIKLILQQNPGIEYLNLYRHFLSYVVNQSPTSPRALSKEWITKAGL